MAKRVRLDRFITEREPLDYYLEQIIEHLDRIANALEASNEQS